MECALPKSRRDTFEKLSQIVLLVIVGNSQIEYWQMKKSTQSLMLISKHLELLFYIAGRTKDLQNDCLINVLIYVSETFNKIKKLGVSEIWLH